MRRLTQLGFLLPAALVLAALTGTDSAAAADATLSVVPASQTVDPGASLSIEVKQNAAAAISGVQTDFNFDAGLLEITDVTKGPAYGTAAFLMGVAVNQAPQTKAEAIAEANTTGTLQNVTTFFVPGTGEVPAGEATFINVAMRAKSGGTSGITLSGAEVLDTGGNPFTVTTTGGTVNVSGATATPSPTLCPGCTPPPTPSPRPATPTPTPPPPLEASLSVTPNSTLVPPTAEFSITVTQQANRPTSGAQTDLKFDAAVVQIVDVTKGREFASTTLITGVVPTPAPEAGTPTPSPTLCPGCTPTPQPTAIPKSVTIAQANASGTLENVAAFLIPTRGDDGQCANCIPAGEAAFITVKLKALADGRSPLELANMEIIDDKGETVGVSANNGEVIVRTGAPFPGALGAVRLPAGGGDTGSDGGSAFPALVLALVVVTGGAIAIRRLASQR